MLSRDKGPPRVQECSGSESVGGTTLYFMNPSRHSSGCSLPVPRYHQESHCFKVTSTQQWGGTPGTWLSLIWCLSCPRPWENLWLHMTKGNFLPSMVFVLGFFFLGRLSGTSSIKQKEQKSLPKILCREQFFQKGTFIREDLSLSSLGPANTYTWRERR